MAPKLCNLNSSQISHCMKLVKPEHLKPLLTWKSCPQHLWKSLRSKQLLQNWAPLLLAHVYHSSVKGMRKYFSTYHTRTCGLFYDSPTSSIYKAVSHWVIVQQSSSNIYLYGAIAEPLYFFVWNLHFWLSFGMHVNMLNWRPGLEMNLNEGHVLQKKTEQMAQQNMKISWDRPRRTNCKWM